MFCLAVTYCLRSQVNKYDDPQEAAIAVVVEAYRLWLQYEVRTDDITLIVARVEGLKHGSSLVNSQSTRCISSLHACISCKKLPVQPATFGTGVSSSSCSVLCCQVKLVGSVLLRIHAGAGAFRLNCWQSSGMFWLVVCCISAQSQHSNTGANVA